MIHCHLNSIIMSKKDGKRGGTETVKVSSAINSCQQFLLSKEKSDGVYGVLKDVLMEKKKKK